MPQTLLRLEEITKNYTDGLKTRQILHSINLELHPHEFTIILGPSGSGKTTLLSILGLIIPPTTGKVFFNEKDLTFASGDYLTTLRMQSIGFVFQNANLLEPLTVLENLLLPRGIQGAPITKADELKAIEYLKFFELGGLVHAMPSTLSGGEKQRVAIIRAMMNEPAIILCDEPTAALDSVSAKQVLETLNLLSQVRNRSIVMITHDPRTMVYADRTLEIENGYLIAK